MTTALILFIYFCTVSAFWRLPCPRQIGLARVDPLVAPGGISGHVHTIHGGNNFGINATPDDLLASKCTSCAIDKDLSAYWTPPLYFQHANGTFQKVPQVGGMLAYYFNNNGAPGERITAFPKGFAMISGDARQRNFTLPMPVPDKSAWKAEDMTQLALAQKSLGFNCLHYQHGNEDALTRHYLPKKSFIDSCYSGLRLEIQFPSCWNGKDLDSPNHKDHVQFPKYLRTGECPEGFDVRLPVLFYETIYAVADFIKYDGQYVISNGDTTGYGYHGDFVNAWDVDFLQAALDTCTDEYNGEVENCPVFSGHIHREVPDECKFEVPPKIAQEDCVGPLAALPGNNPVQSGPDYGPKALPEPLEDGPEALPEPLEDGPKAMIEPQTDATSTETSVSDCPAPSSVITPAPEAAKPLTTAYPIATSTYTEDGEAVHLVVMQEDIVIPETVYVTAAAPLGKRHKHRHRHGHAGRMAA